jgi:hypothetical protein
MGWQSSCFPQNRGFAPVGVYPLRLNQNRRAPCECDVRGLCADCQNASSEMRMISSSMDSTTLRTPVSFGSMLSAKNLAVAILPR